MFEGLFQPMHLLVIFGLALLVFGPKKLPELGFCELAARDSCDLRPAMTLISM